MWLHTVLYSTIVLARNILPATQHILSQESLGPVKVHVQLGVMSRCPDALVCEKLFDTVLNSSKLVDKFDISLVYVAAYIGFQLFGKMLTTGALESTPPNPNTGFLASMGRSSALGTYNKHVPQSILSFRNGGISSSVRTLTEPKKSEHPRLL